MSIGLPLRKDFNALKLRRIARVTKDANQARRALALASVYEGALPCLRIPCRHWSAFTPPRWPGIRPPLTARHAAGRFAVDRQ